LCNFLSVGSESVEALGGGEGTGHITCEVGDGILRWVDGR